MEMERMKFEQKWALDVSCNFLLTLGGGVLPMFVLCH